jgi:transcription termination/antitermination protein NusA
MARRGASISELVGLGEKTVQRLREHGVEKVEQLAQMTPAELTEIPGIGEKTVEKIRKVVTEYFEQGMPSAEEVAPEATTSRLDEVLAAAARAEARREQVLSAHNEDEGRVADGEVAEGAAVEGGAPTSEAEAAPPLEAPEPSADSWAQGAEATSEAETTESTEGAPERETGR